MSGLAFTTKATKQTRWSASFVVLAVFVVDFPFGAS